MNILKNCEKKWIIIIVTAILMINFNSVSMVFADNKDTMDLETKLQQQEDTLKKDMGDKIIPKDDNNIEDTADIIKNAEYKEFSFEKTSNSLTQLINNFVIKSRTTVIIAYALFITVISLYIATIGSRSLNKRRTGLLLLRGNTILFLVFINVPLIIIYFPIFKEHIGEVSIYTRILNIMYFLRENSFVLSALLAYLAVSKLITSKNDLPNRLQGKYLLKASVILLFIFNLAPIAISFII